MSIDEKSDYYDVGGIEVQAIIAAKLTPEQIKGWLLGNVIKYSCRCNHKGTAARDIEKLAVYSKLLDEHQCEMDGEASYWRRVGDIYDETSNQMVMIPPGSSWYVRATMGCASRIFHPGDRVELDCFFREVSSA